MNIHEYQAKELFREHHISVPAGSPVFSEEEIDDVAAKLSFPLVVKAQIHAGGRGKGGGVKIAANAAELHSISREMLGMNLVTPQTGAAGKKVYKLLIEEGVDIAQELYVSVLPDRGSANIVIMASLAGGMDIEQVAVDTPEKIIKVTINPMTSIQGFHCRELAFGLALPNELIRPFSQLVTNLYNLFCTYDCSQVEVNPLIITKDQKLLALDAKVNFDDSALFRHPEIKELHDPLEDDPLEVEATKVGLNYIKLDGNIGAMVNGAGLAMATMDMIKNAGAEPANFLDVGGGASSDMVEKGFQIILQDPMVQGILINIFGGILRCDVLATGIVQAAAKSDIKVPVVVRMEGTNVDEGRRILAESGLNLMTANDLNDAADKVSQIVKGEEL